MGAQWKHSLRQAANNKKGQIVGKLVKEIIVSAKLGGPDPDANFRLRAALEEARKNSVPRDTIDRAIKRGAGLLDDPIQYETITYEGFAPHQVPMIVECLTENRNRTAADIRVLFRKGQLGNTGSVAWMFDRKGLIEASHPDKTLDLESVAIEAGADDVKPTQIQDSAHPQGTQAKFLCAPSDLDSVNKFLSAHGWTISTSEFSYIAKNNVTPSAEQLKEVIDFVSDIDDHDDVHRVYVALNMDEA